MWWENKAGQSWKIWFGTMFPVSASVLTSDILRLPSGLSQELCFLDSFLEMHFVSLWKCGAALRIPPLFSREKQKYLAWRETNPDDFLKSRLWSFMVVQPMEPQRARPRHASVASDNYRTDHHFVSIYHMLCGHTYTWSVGSLVAENMFFRPDLRTERTIVDSKGHSLYTDLISTNLPPTPTHKTFAACLPFPIQTILGESPKSSLIQ